MRNQDKELEKYKRQSFSGKRLMDKITRFAKRAGINAIYYVLLLYNIMLSDEVSTSDKTFILGALGYFLTPFDVVPDFIVGTGFVDDISILLYALSKLSHAITPQIKAKAQQQLHQWFDYEQNELNQQYR